MNRSFKVLLVTFCCALCVSGTFYALANAKQKPARAIPKSDMPILLRQTHHKILLRA